MALSCEDIHKQITEYIDDRINEEEYRQKVAGHINSCPSCREAYEAEVLAKMVVRRRFSENLTPEETRSSIEKSLDALSQSSMSSRYSSYSRQSKRKSPRTPIFVLLLFVTMLGAYILLFKDWGPEEESTEQVVEVQQTTRPSSTPTRKSIGPANYFNLAQQNFQSIIDGGLTVELKASNLEALKQMLSQNGVASVAFAGASSIPLQGGIVSKHSDISLAHLVYQNEKTLLYVLEVPWAVLQSGKIVYVTDDVHEQLENNELVWVYSSGNVNLVMYKNGDAVDVVVANTGPRTMQQMLGVSS